jgi:hypothetical protein
MNSFRSTKGASLSNAVSSRELPLQLVAEGILYSIEIETTTDDLDWLDNVILRVTTERCSLRELFVAFQPLPRRLMENALARLLERNLMLLDVYDGSVRASPLKQVPITTSNETFELWQDHATGVLVPREKISTFEVQPWRPRETDGRFVRVKGGPPRRTPLQMSNAELLHHLRAYYPRVDPQAEVRAKKRSGRTTINLRALQQNDGRLALLDLIPWRLRASWTRVSSLNAKSISDSDFPLPARWEEVVGRWSQEAYDRVVRRVAPRGSVTPLLEVLAADFSVGLNNNAASVTGKLAREARTSVVVAVSGGYGTPSNAMQILMESRARIRVLVVPSSPHPTKRAEWEAEGIQIIVTGQREGPDFVLTDGGALCLGGLASSSLITIRSQSTLEGFVAWLEAHGVSIPRGGSMAAADLAADLRAFEYELVDLYGEPAQRRYEERAPAQGGEETSRIQQYLQDRCGSIEARLLQRNPIPFTWLSQTEVLALIEQWESKIRVVVRTDLSPLAAKATSRGVQCATWTSEGVLADCVILDCVVLLGFSVSDDKSSAPDFLAVADSDFATELRIATSQPQLASVSRP